MARYLILVLVLTLSSVSSIKAEETSLRLIALFKDSAMVEFNGKQKILRKGQSLSPNIKLISANTKFAEFEVNGKKVSLSLNRNLELSKELIDSSSVKSSPTNDNKSQTVQILRNLNGMYETPGFINGRSVHFIIDTGATLVAMDEVQAKRFGIPFRTEGKVAQSSTANGVIKVWRVNIKKVRVGTIELTNVMGSVREGSSGIPVLLGQSFLNRLKVETDNNLMKLKRKF